VRRRHTRNARRSAGARRIGCARGPDSHGLKGNSGRCWPRVRSARRLRRAQEAARSAPRGGKRPCRMLRIGRRGCGGHRGCGAGRSRRRRRRGARRRGRPVGGLRAGSRAPERCRKRRAAKAAATRGTVPKRRGSSHGRRTREAAGAHRAQAEEITWGRGLSRCGIGGPMAERKRAGVLPRGQSWRRTLAVQGGGAPRRKVRRKLTARRSRRARYRPKRPARPVAALGDGRRRAGESTKRRRLFREKGDARVSRGRRRGGRAVEVDTRRPQQARAARGSRRAT